MTAFFLLVHRHELVWLVLVIWVSAATCIYCMQGTIDSCKGCALDPLAATLGWLWLVAEPKPATTAVTGLTIRHVTASHLGQVHENRPLSTWDKMLKVSRPIVWFLFQESSWGAGI